MPRTAGEGMKHSLDECGKLLKMANTARTKKKWMGQENKPNNPQRRRSPKRYILVLNFHLLRSSPVLLQNRVSSVGVWLLVFSTSTFSSSRSRRSNEGGPYSFFIFSFGAGT